jgi:hypothetical protein
MTDDWRKSDTIGSMAREVVKFDPIPAMDVIEKLIQSADTNITEPDYKTSAYAGIAISLATINYDKAMELINKMDAGWRKSNALFDMAMELSKTNFDKAVEVINTLDEYARPAALNTIAVRAINAKGITDPKSVTQVEKVLATVTESSPFNGEQIFYAISQSYLK